MVHIKTVLSRIEDEEFELKNEKLKTAGNNTTTSEGFVHKIVDFLQECSFITVLIGVSGGILFATGQELLALWLLYIFTMLFSTRFAFQRTTAINLSICHSLAFNCEKKNRILKKVKLTSFFKTYFVGYDRHGNMLWFVLLFQCILLLHICRFLLSNIILIIALIANRINPPIWKNLWIAEIKLNYGTIAILILVIYVMNIYRWIKKRKTEQCTHKKSENHNYIKGDLKLLKAKKIIKQKSEIVSFLQQHGLHIDKHNHYIIYSDDINHMEEALSQAFPKLCASISTTEKEKQLFQISRKKDGTLLFQAYIKY